MVDILVDRERHIGIGTVNGTRRCIDQMLNPMMSASLQDVQRTHDITVNICPRILQRIPDAGLGCHVHDPVEPLLLKQASDSVIVFEIQFQKFE